MAIEMRQILGRADAAAFEKHCCEFGQSHSVSLKLYRGALFSWMFTECFPMSFDSYVTLKDMCFSYSPTLHHDNLTRTEAHDIIGLKLLVFPPNEVLQSILRHDYDVDIFENDPDREERFRQDSWARYKQKTGIVEGLL